MKRMIGIDLGTSSSMIKTKEYPDGVSPEAATLDCKAVVFTQQMMASTPTLIRERGQNRWYGYEAEQNTVRDSVLHRNFKIDLRSADPEARARGVALTEDFFGFLYRSYAEQRQFLFDLSKDSPGDEETMVSYPAQWDEAQREIVLDAARKAGFLNVKGMDEATASVHCILNAKKAELIEKGLLQAGKPLNTLIVDMGAGTADLAFVRVTLDGGLKTEILGTWPPVESGYMFGGSQMDELLVERMEKWLEDSGLAPNQAKNIVKGQRSAIKQWKELTMSPLLASGQAVDDCAAISGMCACMGLDLKPFPVLDRESVARDFRKHFETFIWLINSAPQELRDEVEQVILTGGNSQWYWIDEVLKGTNDRFSWVGLPQVVGHPELLLRMELPTETVARGLVYSVMPLKIIPVPHPVQPEVKKDEKVAPKIEPSDPHRFDMPVEPNEMENLSFEQAKALSRYVRRHIAGDSDQQVLITRSGKMLTNKLNLLQRFLKYQIDTSKLQDVREVWGNNERPGYYLFRKGDGGLIPSINADLLSDVVLKVGVNVFSNSVSYNYDRSDHVFVAVLRDGTVSINCYWPEVEEKLRQLADGLSDIAEAISLGKKGLLCLMRTGRLLPLIPETEYAHYVEDAKKSLGGDFPGEVDVVDGRIMYGHDIEAISVSHNPFGFLGQRVALKKGGRVLCCGFMGDRIKETVATWQNIVSVGIGIGYCCGLQADGELLLASEKGMRVICGSFIGFVASETTVLAVTRDGRLHCINMANNAVTDSLVENWNLFD